MLKAVNVVIAPGLWPANPGSVQVNVRGTGLDGLAKIGLPSRIGWALLASNHGWLKL